METLEVSKAVRPDQPGDSIGGFINIHTPSAYDQEESFASLSASTNYTNLTNDWGGKVNALYGTTFGSDDQFGVSFSAVWSERTFGSDNVEADPWELVEDPNSGEEHYVMTDEFQFREYDVERERRGFTTNFEFRPNEKVHNFLRFSYNRYRDIEIRHRQIHAFGEEYEIEDPVTGEEIEGDITEFTQVADDSFPSIYSWLSGASSGSVRISRASHSLSQLLHMAT